MPRLHICNTFFEKELETGSQKALSHWMRSHPIVLQLQFLPLLYADPKDQILVSDLPDHPDPRLCLIDVPPTGFVIEHWGPSLAIAAWAQEHGISYDIPKWEMIRTINSKIFSFTQSPKLPGAALLHSQEEIEAWLDVTPGPKVLKTPFGTAGSGHILNPKSKQRYKFPIIGEPWVKRVMDFSTQWNDEQLIGITVFKNDSNGTYRGTYEGVVEDWALQEHLTIAKPLIKKIGTMGYSGHIGIDAFIYLWERKMRLHPIVEINARKTMSWVALHTKWKQLSYIRSKSGSLPSTLRVHGKTIPFSRNIVDS